MPPMPSPLRLKSKDDDLTWVQRLKRLEKKDVAALGVCLLLLGVLPVIEQVLTNSGEEGRLGEGFAVPGAGNNGEGGDGYEPGVGPGAPGSLPGQSGGEVITPLAGRDPTSLVMGLNGPPKAPPPGSGGGDASAREKGLRDALAESMRRAVPEVSKIAANPTPTSRLSTTLANMLGGGGGSSAAAPGVKGDSAALNAAKKEKGRNVQGASYTGAGTTPGYAGVSKRGLGNTSGDGEKMKAAADAAAAHMNRGSAVEGLLEAAKDSKISGSGESPSAGLNEDAAAKKHGPGGNTSKGERNFGQGLDQQKDMAQWQKWLEECSERKKALSSSFTGAIWLAWPGDHKGDANLFNTSKVDCDQIPSGPLVGFIDKFIGEKLLGSIAGKAADETADKVNTFFWGTASETCVFYTLEGTPGIQQKKENKSKPTKEDPNAKEKALECQNGKVFVRSGISGGYVLDKSGNCFTNTCTPSATEPEGNLGEGQTPAAAPPPIKTGDIAQNAQDSVNRAAQPVNRDNAVLQGCAQRVASDSEVLAKSDAFAATMDRLLQPQLKASNDAEKELREDVLHVCHHTHFEAQAKAREYNTANPRAVPKVVIGEKAFKEPCYNELYPRFVSGQLTGTVQWTIHAAAPKQNVDIKELLATENARREHQGQNFIGGMKDLGQKITTLGAQITEKLGVKKPCDDALAAAKTRESVDPACAKEGVLALKDGLRQNLEKSCKTNKTFAGP